MDNQIFDEYKEEVNTEIFKQISAKSILSSQKIGLALFVKR